MISMTAQLPFRPRREPGAHVLLDGTRVPIDRVVRGGPFNSGKHKKHDAPGKSPVWVRPFQVPFEGVCQYPFIRDSFILDFRALLYIADPYAEFQPTEAHCPIYSRFSIQVYTKGEMRT
jgi:hypothetical protein